MDSFILSEVFLAKPELIYASWMAQEAHSKMTGGGRAIIENVIHGKFAVWDDYIFGNNIELIPGKKIVQCWRTTDFPEDSPDSVIEITLLEVPEGTKLTLEHKNIPAGQGEGYKNGWIEYYFKPMKKFFENETR